MYNHSSARGILFAYDEEKKSTQLLLEALPFNHTTSQSQGSFDLLPNGNWVAGWGVQPSMAEYAGTGPVLENRTGVELEGQTPSLGVAQNLTMLWSAQYAATAAGARIQTYRVRRGQWHGFPQTKPSVVVEDGTLFVSWNGATEVSCWEVLGAQEDASGIECLGKAPRAGFETAIEVGNEFPKYLVHALDKDGNELGCSDYVAPK